MAADSPFWVPALPDLRRESMPLLPRPPTPHKTGMIYTNFSDVDAAVNAVVRGYDRTHQSEVDAMAQAIRDAVKDLVLKGADYTAVDAAISQGQRPEQGRLHRFCGGAGGH